MGSFSSLFFPFCFTLCFLKKNIYVKFLFALLSCGAFALVIGCQSRAGYLGCLVAVCVILPIIFKIILKQKKFFFILILAHAFIYRPFQDSFMNRMSVIKNEAETAQSKMGNEVASN